MDSIVNFTHYSMPHQILPIIKYLYLTEAKNYFYS